jgi:hypothetical protein
MKHVKGILLDDTKPDELELWKFLQTLPHGKFSEGTKSYWLGIMRKVKELKDNE